MNNETMNIEKIKSRLVNSLAGNHTKDIPLSPNKPIHQLVEICMKNTERNGCAYCDLLSKKKITRYKQKSPECNMPLCIVRDRSSPGMGQYCFSLDHHT